MADQRVTEYIKDSLQQGKPREAIYKELLSQGLKVNFIQESFNSLTLGEEREDTQKRTIKIILTIAAILVGVGIFSFIAANWRLMSKSSKVIVIMLGMVISYTFGWFFKEKRHLSKTGGALILLGAIIYGAGIFLVAQMFNIRANWPDGFILWMIGVLVLAFVADSFNLFYLAILTGIGSLVGHPWTIWRTLSGHDPFLLTSSLLLFLATVVTFISGVLMRKKLPPKLKEIY